MSYRTVTAGVFTTFNVGRIATPRGVVLFPPAQIRTTRNRPVPVYTGVTIRPGDTPQSVISAAVAAFPTYLQAWPIADLILQVQDD